MTRLVHLHLTSRRVPAALAVMAVCAIVLWAALHRRWDSYGALQLPLLFEATCASVTAIATASPFGEPERVTGHRLPWLRMGTVIGLTAVAVAALAAAGTGTHLAGGSMTAVRNLAGLTGLGLLCATLFGGVLAWTAPATYALLGMYALYTRWHGPALTSPWIWPGRPGDDLGGALCAGAILIAGLVAITVRGARDGSPPAG